MNLISVRLKLGDDCGWSCVYIALRLAGIWIDLVLISVRLFTVCEGAGTDSEDSH